MPPKGDTQGPGSLRIWDHDEGEVDSSPEGTMK